MIEATALTKRYGRTVAVDGLSFQVRPGSVTGFLGPNGAGKSTTVRMIVGLDAPTAGSVTVGGRDYRTLRDPLRAVGVLLDAGGMHGGRRARDHLGWLAHAGGLPRRRVDEVLALTGLTGVADRRVGGFSLGMRQRLGIAAALLGDPGTLILDEPVNGLDAEGVRWVRGLLRDLAGEGRTILLSSHLLSEMEQTADRLIVIGQGRLLAETTMREFIGHGSAERSYVRTPDPERFGRLLAAAGATVRPRAPGLEVGGLPVEAIGSTAAEHGIVLYELTPLRSSLEDVYTRLTETEVEYRGRAA